MKIESYEPYHIGTKLHPYMNLESFKEKVKRELGKRGYEVPKEIVVEPIKLPLEVLGTKGDTKVELNLSAQAVNVIGTSPKSVMDVFKQLMTIMPSLGYELEAAIGFHEIIANINIKTTEKPLEILKKSSKIKFKLLRDIGNIGLTGLRISNIGEEGEIVNFIIEPNPASPKTRFLVRFMFRTRDRNRLELFHGELENRIHKVLTQLRGKK